MILVSYVISLRHVIKKGLLTISRSLLRKIIILPFWIMVLACHVISEDHVIKGS